MLPEELVAAGDLAGQGYGGLVGSIRQTHGAIARRVFRYVGQPARPVQLAHDAIAEVAYGSTRLLGRTLVEIAGRGAAATQGEGGASVERSPAGRVVKGALSGAFGDRLAEEGSPLAVQMAVRRRGRDIPPEPSALAGAFPRATPKLAIFLHGLCETDDAWWLAARAARGPDAPPFRTYGQRLRDELGYTPLYVRYNSGLHISANGRRLAELIERVVAGWPCEVEQITLIGHSMGGLVARSACHYGAETAW